MRHPGWIRATGLALVATLSLSIGDRSTTRAGQPAPAATSTAVVAGAFGGSVPQPEATVVHVAARPTSKDAARIIAKLQERVPMEFPIGTTLVDVVKHIRQQTVDKVDFPEGIPVYLDPVGLQEADKTPDSMVTIDLKGIPLATTLKLALDQLTLAYWVHPDGLLMITSKDNEDIPVDADHAILEQLAALRREIKALREEVRFTKAIPAADGPYPGPPDSKPSGGMGGQGGMR